MDLLDFSKMAFRLSLAPTAQSTYHKISEMVLIEISLGEESPPTDAENGVMIQWVPPRHTGSRKIRRLAPQLAAVEGISTNNLRRAA